MIYTSPDLNYIACDGDVYLLDHEGIIAGKVVPCTIECAAEVSNIKGGECTDSYHPKYCPKYGRKVVWE